LEEELNELQKWNIASEINENYNFESILLKLTSITRPPQVKFISKKIDFQTEDTYTPIPFKIAIIDFEGSPAILTGLMIQDTILTYYIEDYQFLNEFYLVILEILIIIRDVPLFCFSVYEQQEILRIYTFLSEQGYDLSQYEFIKSLPVINLQKNKSESVTEALFSINSKIRFTGDPLFRNIKVIDKLFITKRFEEVIAHNHTCLLNESLILQRWVKYYHI
jgi:hypothetical protein